MSSPVEHRADNAAEVDFRGLGPGSRRTARTENMQFQQNIVVLCILAWLAELAESQPQVLKWAPVCSESGVV